MSADLNSWSIHSFWWFKIVENEKDFEFPARRVDDYDWWEHFLQKSADLQSLKVQGQKFTVMYHCISKQNTENSSL